MWNDKKQSPKDIDEVLNSSLKDLVYSRPGMDGSSGRKNEFRGSGSGIPPVKPAAAAATMPLYPIPPDSDDDSEEFDFKKIAASAIAPYPNGDGDQKMAAVPLAPNGASNSQMNGRGDFKMAPMAPGHDDDYEDRMAKKMAANPAPLTKPAPSYSSEPPRKMTPEEKIQEKIRQEDAMRASARQNSASFLTRPDRMEDKLLMEKKKAAYYNTGTSTPGAQSVAPPPQVNDGPRAEVTPVQTAEPEEQHKKRRSSIKQEDNQNLLVYGVVGVAVVVVVVVVAVVAVMLSGGDEGGDSGPQTEAPVPLTPNEEYLLALLPEQSHAAIEAADNSPQAQAWRWLAEYPGDLTAGIYSDETIYQRFALATLFYSANGLAWKDREFWLSHNAHECTWWGSEELPCDQEVEVGSTDYVGLKHLMLNGNGLSGTLPPQVGLLTSLETLNLDDNSLQGGLPDEVGNMTQIIKIDLTTNQLTGKIPITMGNLMNLEQIYMEQNQLTGNIPRALASPPLKYVRLSSNNMRGTVYPELCSIRSLKFDCSPAKLCGCGECDGC